MNKLTNVDLTLVVESTIDEVFYLDTIIKFTKEACFELEMTSQYYNLSPEEQIKLSNERNHYINMLSIAQEKIDNLKEILTQNVRY